MFACGKGVEHEHANRHWPYSTGDGRDVGAEWCHVFEIDIALQTEAALLGGIGYACGAHINDDGSLLHHVGLEERRLSDGCDDDVGLQAFLLEGLAATVANGHGGIAILLLHHELCHGFAHDVAAAKDDALLAARRYLVAAKQLEDTFWRSADVAGQADCHTANVDGMEAVHVLTVVDGFYDFLFADVLGQGKLHDEAIDGGIVVEFIYLGKQLHFGDVVFKAKQSALEAASLAGQHLVAHISLAASVVSDQDGCKVRTLAALRYNIFYLLFYLCLNRGSRLFSVYQFH